MLYFKIDPSNNAILNEVGGDLAGYNTKADSAVNGKPYLVPVAVTDPSFNPATQVKEGPVDAYDGTNATRVYTVRPKTQQELDADQRNADLAYVTAALKDIAIVTCAIVDTLVAKGLVMPSDVEQTARTAYQNLKQRVDRIKQ